MENHQEALHGEHGNFWILSIHKGAEEDFEVLPQTFVFFFSFYFLAMPCGMWDLSPQPGIEPVPPAVGVQSPNHCTAREFPQIPF